MDAERFNYVENTYVGAHQSLREGNVINLLENNKFKSGIQCVTPGKALPERCESAAESFKRRLDVNPDRNGLQLIGN